MPSAISLRGTPPLSTPVSDVEASGTARGGCARQLFPPGRRRQAPGRRSPIGRASHPHQGGEHAATSTGGLSPALASHHTRGGEDLSYRPSAPSSCVLAPSNAGRPPSPPRVPLWTGGTYPVSDILSCFLARLLSETMRCPSLAILVRRASRAPQDLGQLG